MEKLLALASASSTPSKRTAGSPFWMFVLNVGRRPAVACVTVRLPWLVLHVVMAEPSEGVADPCTNKFSAVNLAVKPDMRSGCQKRASASPFVIRLCASAAASVLVVAALVGRVVEENA